MNDNRIHGNDAAREALAALRKGLDSARRVVERTRFVLSGAMSGEGDVLVPGGAQAAGEPLCETVQNPDGE